MDGDGASPAAGCRRASGSTSGSPTAWPTSSTSPPTSPSYDVHPPLYFGLLHGWLLVTGEHVWAGRALNLVFAALAVLAHLRVGPRPRLRAARGRAGGARLGGEPGRGQHLVDRPPVRPRGPDHGAARVGAGAGRAGAERRAARGVRPAWLDVLWLAAATAAALLTHYQAVLLVAGGVALRPRRRRSWPAGTAGAALVAAAPRPGRRRARRGLARAGLVRRLRPRALQARRLLRRACLLEKLAAISQTLGRFVAVPGVVIGVRPRRRRRGAARWSRARGARLVRAHPDAPGRAGGRSSSSSLVTAGGICLQNLLFLSMPPRISARYLAMAWPFLAFLPLLLFGLWPRRAMRSPRPSACWCSSRRPSPRRCCTAAPTGCRCGRLADADAVLVDNVGVGELPRFLWSVPADAPVFAGTQEAAPRRQGRLDATRDLGDKAYYVSILRTGGVALAPQPHPRQPAQARTRSRRWPTNGMAEIYAITPKAAE